MAGEITKSKEIKTNSSKEFSHSIVYGSRLEKTKNIMQTLQKKYDAQYTLLTTNVLGRIFYLS